VSGEDLRLGPALITREEIAERVERLGQELARDLLAELEREGLTREATDRIVLIPVMAGAMIFTADLTRHMPLTLSMRLVSVSSYPGESTTSKGAKMQGALPTDLGGRHVVVVDDILDTGQTLGLLQRLIRAQGPASLRTCVLLRKECERMEHADAEYVGFDIPDAFVVGYGLDFDGHYRNLPEIRTLESAG